MMCDVVYAVLDHGSGNVSDQCGYHPIIEYIIVDGISYCAADDSDGER